MTAGHVFTKYREAQAEGIVALEHRLHDFWGDPDNYSQAIVFDFFDEAEDRIVEFNEDAGLDFALIPMPHLVVRALSETITPFRRIDWCQESLDVCDRYFMIGLPGEKASDDIFTSDNEAFARIGLALVVLRVDRVSEAEAKETKYPQFVGKLAGDAVKNIKGMSGGPIIGMRYDDNGNLRYYPVALQSRWIAPRRITIGCLIDVFATMAEVIFDGIQKRLESGEDPEKVWRDVEAVGKLEKRSPR